MASQTRRKPQPGFPLVVYRDKIRKSAEFSATRERGERTDKLVPPPPGVIDTIILKKPQVKGGAVALHPVAGGDRKLKP